MLRPSQSHVDLLILGAGWTSTFLIPLLQSENVSFAATTTTGRDGTIPFVFEANDSSDDSKALEKYRALPDADTILVTFPLKGAEQSRTITDVFDAAHASGETTKASRRWIQLGSTLIFKGDGWHSCNGAYTHDDDRAQAEDELMKHVGGAALDLAGLYDYGPRNPREWVARVATNKEQVKAKKAVHLVHGADVARAILETHRNWDEVKGRRWIISDCHVYDWWDLFTLWGPSYEAKDAKLQYTKWVFECMEEEGVKALPRDSEVLGRKIDARDFWKAVGCWPAQPRLR